MQPPGSTIIPLLVVGPVIVWRLYRRMRTSIGRQALSQFRPWITVTVFTVLIALLGSATAMIHPEGLLWLVGAVCVGAALGVFALSKTRFENTPQGLFYTPNSHIGIALSVLLAARVVYRMVQIYSADPGAQAATPDFARSPLTLAVIGLLAGYYVAYALGLIRWRKKTVRL